MGRTTYTDSCSWVQRFCSEEDDVMADCAPTGVECDYASMGLPEGYTKYRCPCQADRPNCDPNPPPSSRNINLNTRRQYAYSV